MLITVSQIEDKDIADLLQYIRAIKQAHSLDCQLNFHDRLLLQVCIGVMSAQSGVERDAKYWEFREGVAALFCPTESDPIGQNTGN